jgi:hypothetical protein
MSDYCPRCTNDYIARRRAFLEKRRELLVKELALIDAELFPDDPPETPEHREQRAGVQKAMRDEVQRFRDSVGRKETT